MTTSTLTFSQRFAAASQRNNSLLCVGLDPDPARTPAGLSTREFLFGVVEATADLVACYKPNIAFFEQEGADGIALLRELIAVIPGDIPVLLDAKRGDIGHTSEAYARAVFDILGAHAVTLSPYLGRDALDPFLRREDRHAFVLCRTSNPGAGDLQDLPVGDHGEPLYLHVARLAKEWNERGNVGLVVGATYPEEARRIRQACPGMLFLLPGVGAQQGAVDDAVQAAVDADGGGILVNASRAVLYAEAGDPGCAPGGWAEASREAARHLRDQVNDARSG